MKIDKQRLILKALLFYLPLMLCLASLELFNNFILFILIYIFLMAFMAIMFLLKKRNSRINYLYDNLMSSKNAPADRSPIIFWGSMVVIVLLIAIFMFSGWFFTNIGMLVFFAISFGFGMFMQCITFNFENKEG